ncbi:MAG: ATP synthase subunit I [Candidatus Brocadiaceae bacterium]|nr:ATP synthase subunit I [Candidatus Brocadiaceae bacterium]
MIYMVFFIFVALAVGMVLGIINHAGIWCTIHHLSTVKYPAIVLMISYIVRMGMILTTFYLVMDNKWERLIACVVGFFIVRNVLIRRFRPVSGSHRVFRQ